MRGTCAFGLGLLVVSALQAFSCNAHFLIETIDICRDNVEQSEKVLQSLCPIFVEAFADGVVAQLKDEQPESYVAMQKAGLTMRDILPSRFKKIIEVMLSQVAVVQGTCVIVLKNEQKEVVGYALFVKDPIHKILHSMIARDYITSVLSLSREVLSKEDGNKNDQYLLSLALSPSLQGQGLGKKMVFSVVEYDSEVAWLYLLTAASRINIPIQQFYERLGFSREGSVVTVSKQSDKFLLTAK